MRSLDTIGYGAKLELALSDPKLKFGRDIFGYPSQRREGMLSFDKRLERRKIK
jgi:hypothetical protein